MSHPLWPSMLVVLVGILYHASSDLTIRPDNFSMTAYVVELFCVDFGVKI